VGCKGFALSWGLAGLSGRQDPGAWMIEHERDDKKHTGGSSWMEDGNPRSPLGLSGKYEEVPDVKRLVFVL
jgi:hypothetical protein